MYTQATHFNLCYNRSKKYEHIASDIIKAYPKYSKEVWCIITNTARALLYRAKAMSVPKNKIFYYNNPQDLNYRKMFALLDSMAEEGYFIYHKGGFLTKKSNAQSVYWFTEKWLSLWEGVDVTEEKEYVQAVQVKDRDSGELLSNRGRTGVKELSMPVEKLNKLLEKTSIVVDKTHCSVQQYTRIFNDDLTKGGRFYNTAGGVQTIPQIRRAMLKIDDECVVELDFRAMHCSLLYEKVWQESPQEVEEWVSSMWDGSYNPYPIISPHFCAANFQDDWVVRKLNKYAVMVSLNAKDFSSAYKALASEWRDDNKREERKYAPLSYPIGLKDKPTFPASAICKHVQEWNKPISEYFFSDVGIILQNLDSMIVASVIEALYEDDEILLPVHDSVVVREAIADEVEMLMRKAYKEVMGSDKFCYIDRK